MNRSKATCLAIFLTLSSCGVLLAQTAPAGQLSRHSSRKKAKVPSTATFATLVTPNCTLQAPAAPPPAPGPQTGAQAKAVAIAANAEAQKLSATAEAYMKTLNAATASPDDESALVDRTAFVDLTNDCAGSANAAQVAAAAAATTAPAVITAEQQAVAADDAAKIALTRLLNDTPPTAATLNIVAPIATDSGCAVNGVDSNGNATYRYRTWIPLWHKGCNDATILYYFGVNGTTTVANQIQYVYAQSQSTNEVNADLLTATFRGGFQAILAGTAASGASQPANAGSGVASTTQTESAATAISKLEEGGDFNLRFTLPLAQYSSPLVGFSLTLLPNMGFLVNGLSSQATITQSTQYSFNMPVEAYAEFGSIPSAGGTTAVFFADAKFGSETVSKAFQTATGLAGTTFVLGEFSAGIEFLKSVRVGFQYFVGPSAAYCVPSATGCTAATGSVSGVHLAISFSPQTKSGS